jgi:hypothetical protein
MYVFACSMDLDEFIHPFALRYRRVNSVKLIVPFVLRYLSTNGCRTESIGPEGHPFQGVFEEDLRRTRAVAMCWRTTSTAT